MKRLIATLTLGLALAACSSGPTRYIPALDGDDMGYREQRIEEQRYRVSFRANPDLKAADAEDMALRRAAELTIQNGYQWFHVVSRMTDVAGGSRSSGDPAPSFTSAGTSLNWKAKISSTGTASKPRPPDPVACIWYASSRRPTSGMFAAATMARAVARLFSMGWPELNSSASLTPCRRATQPAI